MGAEMYGAVVLAAGSSSRLGQPKALLPFGAGMLIDHVLGELDQAGFGQIVVVTGADENVAQHLARKQINSVHNPDWQEGMRSSIRVGVAHMLKDHAQKEGVLFAVCDQPHVSAALFGQMMRMQAKGIVACAYGGTVGIPALFDKRYFPELLALQGKSGAKELLQRHADDVVICPFPQGSIDIDTLEDYHRLMKGNI